MSLYTNRSTVSLLNMVWAMFRKGIENARIVKAAVFLLMSGVSPSCIDREIVESVANAQRKDGGFIGTSDTVAGVRFLQFYPEYKNNIQMGLEWLQNLSNENGGWGRSKRDMHRIPSTGFALWMLPELSQNEPKHLQWLEQTWLSERNGLTYKAAYTLMAFAKNKYIPRNEKLIAETQDWLASQQKSNGGFAPWKDHPVETDIFCTAVSTLGLLAYPNEKYYTNILASYRYMCDTQLTNGIWRFHEIEDGASWGLLAMSEAEKLIET
ncbi:MAG: terpene cyclase/mutase family protein [Planctomycetaceae bacterium]|jgi:prenyltransferase beta subunit|nr:terpene cyclase/mutase family protein [Planctomycetaceae bacterium]